MKSQMQSGIDTAIGLAAIGIRREVAYIEGNRDDKEMIRGIRRAVYSIADSFRLTGEERTKFISACGV